MKLKSLKDGRVTSDGKQGALTLEMEDGTSIDVEMDVPSGPADLILRLLGMTAEVGALPTPHAKGMLNLKPQQIRLGLSGPGHTLVAFHFGALDLAMHLPNDELKQIAEFLSKQATLVTQEPSTPQ